MGCAGKHFGNTSASIRITTTGRSKRSIGVRLEGRGDSRDLDTAYGPMVCMDARRPTRGMLAAATYVRRPAPLDPLPIEQLSRTNYQVPARQSCYDQSIGDRN